MTSTHAPALLIAGLLCYFLAMALLARFVVGPLLDRMGRDEDED